MKTLAKVLTVLTVIGTVAPAAMAHSHHHWNDEYRYNQQPYCNQSVINPYNAPGYAYNPYVGSYINSGVGADGYPAWMGGYRPR